jgi:hypothetical protein
MMNQALSRWIMPLALERGDGGKETTTTTKTYMNIN